MKTIDLNTWPRKNIYEFFSSYEDPQFNICANLTITKTFENLNTEKDSLFLVMLWLISEAANSVAEIRYRIRNKTVIEHPRVHPSFTWLNDDNTFTFCQAHHSSCFEKFVKNAEQTIEKIESNPVVADKQAEDDVIYVSCIPWVSFTSISHPDKKDDTRSIPRITWGRYFRQQGELLMPVSLQLHHGLADGYHAGLFFSHLQKQLNDTVFLKAC